MNNKEIQTNVEVKDMPELHVAYVRHIGPYKGDQELFGRLFNKLMAWAGPRGLLRFPETKIMAIYHDNPDITDESRLRTDACITVPEDTQVEGEIGKAKIPAGKYAVAHFEITPDQYQEAWNAIYGGWLPESGYQPEDGPCYEVYLSDPKQHPEGKHVVDICVPLKPL
jgi:AraC family transcriptional regulator